MLLPAILILPALAAVVSALRLGQRLTVAVTALSSLLVLLLASVLALDVAAGGHPVAVAGWLACDPLAAITLWLVALVGAAASLFSWAGLARSVRGLEPQVVRRYYAGHNLFLLSILAIPLLTQVAMVWIAVALTTLLSAFLVSVAGSSEALEAAWKYVVLTSLGATIALFGVLLLHWAGRVAGASSFTWSELSAVAASMPAPLVLTALLFLLVGFGTKLGLVPLHTWLPETYDQAPTSVCALLSGAEAAAVLNVLLRLVSVVTLGGVHAGGWLIGLGLLSTAVAALLLVQAKDLKRLFAFSTIEHMGIILVAAGLGSEAGGLGALYQMVGHSLAKSLCFFAAGLAIVAAGSRDMGSIRGLVRSSPVAGVGLLVGGLAISGVPPFAVFIGELAIFRAGLSGHHYLIIGALALFVVIAFCAVMARINSMVFGEPLEGGSRGRPAASSVLALAVVALPLVVLGLYWPARLGTLFHAAARALGGS